MDVYAFGHDQERQGTQRHEVTTVAEMNATGYR